MEELYVYPPAPPPPPRKEPPPPPPATNRTSADGIADVTLNTALPETKAW